MFHLKVVDHRALDRFQVRDFLRRRGRAIAEIPAVCLDHAIDVLGVRRVEEYRDPDVRSGRVAEPGGGWIVWRGIPDIDLDRSKRSPRGGPNKPQGEEADS